MGPEGTVVSWSWMPEPLAGQPLAEPFAWALIRLDGADTAMLHAVDAGSAAAMRTGLRVRPRWAARPAGGIRDIACFEPCDGPAGRRGRRRRPDQGAERTPGMTIAPVRLRYLHTASPGESCLPARAGANAGCSGSGAGCAGRCTCRRGGRARPTG